MKTGALYIRVSTHMQDELSPDAQKRLLLEYAKTNDILISSDYIFIENGISGRKVDKRPEFQKMISLAKTKPTPFDTILVWKFSRFARNQEESIVYKSLLRRQCNIDVVSVSEPLIDGPFGSLIERIIEWMDEYYSIRLSGEVTRGMTEKALRGGYQARPPLGYKISVKGEPPVIVPEEAKIVRIIFEKYVHEKQGYFDIARYLNSLGYKTSHGKSFEARSIDYIIQNPTYCGMIRWNRTENETNRIKDKDEWIITEGHHEPIIGKELFDAAQDRYKSTYRPRGARPSSTYRHWLSGLLKCPHCGRTMIAKRVVKKSNGANYAYFTCYGYSKGKCLIPSNVSSLKLEPAVLSSLKEILDTKTLSFEYKVIEPTEEIDERGLLEEQLQQISLKEQRIKTAYREGIDTIEEYKHNREIIERERDELQQKISELESVDMDTSDDKAIMLKKIQNVYEVVSSSDYTNQQKNEMLKTIVDKFVYDKENDTLNAYYYLAKPQ
ncbi:MAG: recombinase family protein [Clostridiales bacterium]|nr:recombinase family protein [Clostridiales bacterium]